MQKFEFCATVVVGQPLLLPSFFPDPDSDLTYHRIGADYNFQFESQIEDGNARCRSYVRAEETAAKGGQARPGLISISLIWILSFAFAAGYLSALKAWWNHEAVWVCGDFRVSDADLGSGPIFSLTPAHQHGIPDTLPSLQCMRNSRFNLYR